MRQHMHTAEKKRGEDMDSDIINDGNDDDDENKNKKRQQQKRSVNKSFGPPKNTSLSIENGE